MTVIAFLNPYAKDGEGQRRNEGIATTLRGHFGADQVEIEARPIPDEQERAEAWKQRIREVLPGIIFPAGGDGTQIGVIEATLGGPFRDIDAVRASRIVPGTVINGIGTGSAQDLKAVLGFPTPQELQHFLSHPEEQQTFELGAMWMIREDAQGKPLEIHLAGHSLSWGFISYVFERRERYYQEWKSDPANAGKPVPFYLNTLMGRVLQAPMVALKQAREFIKGFRGHTVNITLPNGEQRSFTGTAVTGVFPLPLMANYFALPMANPLAGRDFQAVMIVLPYHPTVIPLVIEGLLRGVLAKRFGFKGLIGPGANFLSLRLLNLAARFKLWNPERMIALKQGDEVAIEVSDVKVVDLIGTTEIKPHEGQGVLNGDLIPPMPRARVIVGGKDQVIPVRGRKDSVLGVISRRRELNKPHRGDLPAQPQTLQRMATPPMGPGLGLPGPCPALFPFLSMRAGLR